MLINSIIGNFNNPFYNKHYHDILLYNYYNIDLPFEIKEIIYLYINIDDNEIKVKRYYTYFDIIDIKTGGLLNRISMNFSKYEFYNMSEDGSLIIAVNYNYYCLLEINIIETLTGIIKNTFTTPIHAICDKVEKLYCLDNYNLYITFCNYYTYKVKNLNIKTGELLNEKLLYKIK